MNLISFFHSGMGFGIDISCFLTDKEGRALKATGQASISNAVKQTRFRKMKRLYEAPNGLIGWREE
jgi:hypothetical protein